MSEKFLKPHIDRPGVLDPTPGDPQGYVTKDGMWAAVPIMNSGSVVHTAQNYTAAKNYILKEIKKSKKK